MADNLLKQIKATRVSNAVVAGTTTIDCTAIDMANFDDLFAVVAFGTLTAGAVTSLKWAQSSDNGVADDFTDLLGSGLSIVDTDDNKLLISELVRPSKRYVRLSIVRGTANAVIDSATCFQYGARVLPVTQSSTVAGTEQLFSPAEGTA